IRVARGPTLSGSGRRAIPGTPESFRSKSKGGTPVPRIVFSPQILPKTVVDLARSMAPAGFDLTVADPGTAAFSTAVSDAEYFLGFVRGGMDDAFFKGA